jgi:predicted Ser/Thr protein kinase
MKVTLRVVAGPDAGRTFAFEARDRFMIGRAPTAHFQISSDPYFSRHHLMLEVNPPNVLAQDLKSTNGTWVNNQSKMEAPVTLKHGDTIGGGKTRIEIAIEDDVGVAVTVPPTPVPIAGKRPSKEIPVTYPGAPDRVAVHCLRCKAPASNELPRSRAEDMAYFCDACQVAILDEPKLLPEYQVVKELGRGGMGAVYLALHKVLGRRAIKVILPRAAMSQRVRDTFVREATSHAMLDHPRVVRVLDFKESEPGIFCMVMEYVDGTNAEELLRASPRGLEPRVAATIVAQALEGLAHAHAKGIVHRDIKDANLLVARDQHGHIAVKLSDFGLAKSYETSGASGFTRTGDVSGTVPYMAPEQILDFRNVRPAARKFKRGFAAVVSAGGEVASGGVPLGSMTRA